MWSGCEVCKAQDFDTRDWTGFCSQVQTARRKIGLNVSELSKHNHNTLSIIQLPRVDIVEKTYVLACIWREQQSKT